MHLPPGTKKNIPSSSNQTPRPNNNQTPLYNQNMRQPMLETTNRSSLAPTFPDSDRRSTSSPEPDRRQYLTQPNPYHRTPAQSSRSATEKRRVEDVSDSENNTPRDPKRPRPADPEDSETEDEDPEDVVAPPPPSEEKYMAMLTNKGRIAVRYVSSWSHWPTVFALGLKHGAHANTCLFTTQQKEDYDTFQRLLRLIPDLLDALHYFGEQSPIKLGRAFQKGSKSAHASSVDVIKRYMGEHIEGYKRNEKNKMGYRNPECARILVPADLDLTTDRDYDNEKGLLRSLQTGVLVPSPVDFNRGLYRDEEVNPDDLSQGFCMNNHMVEGYKVVFFGPSSIQEGGHKGTVKGNAVQHGIDTCSLDSIVFIASLIHFGASAQLVYNGTGGNGQFNYHQYGRHIKTTICAWPEEQIKDLLDWWNEQIFPETARPIAKRPDGALSIAERMQAQAAAAREAAYNKKRYALEAIHQAAIRERLARPERTPSPSPSPYVLIGTHLSLPHHHHLPVCAPHPASFALLASHRLLNTPLKSLRASPASRTPTSAQSASVRLRLKTPQQAARGVSVRHHRRLVLKPRNRTLADSAAQGVLLPGHTAHRRPTQGRRVRHLRPRRRCHPRPLELRNHGSALFPSRTPHHAPHPPATAASGAGRLCDNTPTTAPPLALVVDVGAALESCATAARLRFRSRTTPTPSLPPFQAGRGSLFATTTAPPLPLPTRAAALSLYYANPARHRCLLQRAGFATAPRRRRRLWCSSSSTSGACTSRGIVARLRFCWHVAPSRSPLPFHAETGTAVPHHRLAACGHRLPRRLPSASSVGGIFVRPRPVLARHRCFVRGPALRQPIDDGAASGARRRRRRERARAAESRPSLRFARISLAHGLASLALYQTHAIYIYTFVFSSSYNSM
ncbi:hypothetical protein C8R43DRAFT_1244937 [Mycena crocata]|nr:hypothetical protein C8R43DRAFT_1244937 [Mycena crocata]